MNKILVLIITIFISTIALGEQVIKEETTPPATEGPITPDQIPPILNLKKEASTPDMTKQKTENDTNQNTTSI